VLVTIFVFHPLEVIEEAEVEVVFFPVNNAPLLTVGNTRLSAGASLGSLFMVSDPDVTFLQASVASVYLSRPERCCFLALNVTCSGCVLRGAYPSSSVLLVGTPTDLTRLLSEVSIYPLESAARSIVRASLDDLQSYGAGEAITIEAIVNVVFQYSASLPTIEAPAAVTVRSLKAYSLQELMSSTVQLTNFDSAAVLTLRVEAINGKLHLPLDAVNGLIPTESVITAVGSPRALTASLASLLYWPPSLPADILLISVIDDIGHNLATVNISIAVKAFALPIPLALAQTYLVVDQGHKATLDDLLFPSPPLITSPFDDSTYSATVGCRWVGVLEEQLVTTDAAYADHRQVITILAPEGESVGGGSFSLAIDLSAFGLGVLMSSSIRADAPAMKWSLLEDEYVASDYDINNSVESKVTTMLAPLTVRFQIQVSAQRVRLNSSTSYTVVLHNAPFDFPLMFINSSEVLSSAGGAFKTSGIEICCL
jgi:hypothetical protein